MWTWSELKTEDLFYIILCKNDGVCLFVSSAISYVKIRMSVCSFVHLSRIDILAECQEFLGGYIGLTDYCTLMSLGNTLGSLLYICIYYLFSNKSYS